MVVFTVRRLDVIARAERELQMADAYDELDYLQRRAAIVRADVVKRAGNDADEETIEKAVTPEEFKELSRIKSQIARLTQAKFMPSVFASQLVAVSGFEDVEAFVASAPDELLFEAYGLCEMASKLSPEQLKNLESPGTSAQPAAGQSENTTAATADPLASSTGETAASTHPTP